MDEPLGVRAGLRHAARRGATPGGLTLNGTADIPRGLSMGSVLPAGTAQPGLPPAEVYGPAVFLTNYRELPLSERRMVLYTYSATDVSPADPCNKMSCHPSTLGAAARQNPQLNA